MSGTIRRWVGLGLAVLAVSGAVTYAAFELTRAQLSSAEQLQKETGALQSGERALVFLGDFMPWDRAAPLLERYGATYPFRATLPLIRQATLSVLNLEGPVAEHATKSGAKFSYRVPPWILRGLVDAGIDAVGLANNHTLDCGTRGLDETLQGLALAHIGAFGAGEDQAQASTPLAIRRGDLTVALVGFVAPETMYFDQAAARRDPGSKRATRTLARTLGARPGRPGTAILTEPRLRKALERAREQADFVVAFMHWGIRYQAEPTAFQRAMAHAAIDAGADLVIGHHAHQWQPIEIYRGKPVVYGLGNYAFGSRNRRAREGLLARAVLRGTRLTRVELYPLLVNNRDRRVNYQPKAMAGRAARTMLEQLARASEPFDASIEIVGAHAVVRLGDGEAPHAEKAEPLLGRGLTFSAGGPMRSGSE